MLTDEAKAYLQIGSPEAQLFYAIPEEGISLAQLKVHNSHSFMDHEMLSCQTTMDAAVTGIGFNQAMAQKWVEVKKDKGTSLIFRKVVRLR